MKKWIKFLKAWEQKSASGEVEKFAEGDVIQVDEEIAKSLIQLGMAEETEEPKSKDDGSLEKAMTRLSSIVEKSVSAAFDNASKGMEEKFDKSFATIKDKDAEGLGGFKDEGHFLKCVMQAGIAAKTGSQINPDAVGGQDFVKALNDALVKAPSGQNVSTDSEGGFMVPDVMTDRIWTNMEENPASFLPMTDRYETTGNSTKIRKMNETSRKAGTGLRHAGIQVTWLDEADEIQATQAVVGRDTLELHKVGAVVYFTEEQLDDAPTTWNRRIQRLVPDAIMFETNYQFLHGSGVGKPKGVSKEDSLICVPTGARDGSAQANHTLLHWNLSQMYWRNLNRSNSIWVAHPDCAQQMEFITFDDDATNKRPIYTPINRGLTLSGAELFVGPYGRPMLVHEMAYDFGTKSDIGLYDFSQYASLTKVGGGIKTAMSIHVRFLFEETAFRFTFRIGGKSLWTAPKEDLHGDTTRSPFIQLASRTGGGTSSGL